MKLIDKAALVAEIERLKTIYNDNENIHHVAKYNILVDILSFLNTLEVKEIDIEQLNKLLNWWKEVTTDYSAYKVKEVDLEKEIDNFGLHYDGVVLDRKELIEFAKHFFELALSLKNS